jgi:aspartyl-tRNA(Asn)/glutamyl-tRNA(Gln) amidotransferase subunit C
MITRETIQHLAKLARVELSPEREEQLTQDVSKILDYVDALKSVPTDGLPEVAQVTGLKNALRDDASGSAELATPAELLATAPQTEQGYVKVKAIFE